MDRRVWAMPSASDSSWVCDACGRRVPRRVEACRCGSRRRQPVPDAATETERRGSPLALLVVGLVIGAALAIPAWSSLTRRAEPPAPAASPAPPPAPPAAEPPPADVAADPDPPAPAGADDTAALEDVVARVVPAVASIQAGGARGTGFFVRPDTLLTNAHVVEGQAAIRLQIGNRTHTARVKSMSRGSDLAVLQVLDPNPAQPALPLGSASHARVGQEVIAVGSAFGVLSNTVTRGIVSGVRQVGPVRLVQTDAAINPGNSGGPLLDRNGTVIGVSSMTVARHAGEGVAFAVAIDHATELLQGRGAAEQGKTPLAGLEQMIAPKPEPEDPRAHAERAYGQTLAAAARRAEQIDEYWQRYESSCVMSADRLGARPWFSAFAANGVRINPHSPHDCAGWLRTLQSAAQPIRAMVEGANEAARRDGVYPGVLRDLRRQHRLDWQD
jgi:hypothetical protein